MRPKSRSDFPPRALSRSRAFAVCLCLLWSSAAALAADAPAEAEAVIVDNAFKTLRPAIFRQSYQRILDEGERPFWSDPGSGGAELEFEGQSTIFGQDVLWVDPIALGKVQMARAERLGAVLAIVTPERMQTAIREAAERAGAGEGAVRVVFAREAGKAQVAQVLADRDSGNAMAIQGPVYASFIIDPGAVLMSWDDRQILITLRVQRFRKVRGKHMSIRDLGPLTNYHYVGVPVPEGVDPLVYWTANDGERLLAALRNGYERIIRSARLPVPKDIERERGAIAVVMVDGVLQRFPGVLVDQDAEVARLALGKVDFLLVDTGAKH